MNKILTKKEMSAWVKATWEKCQKEAWGQSEMTREKMQADGWRQCAVGQKTTQFCGMLEQAVAAERERCAKACEEQIKSFMSEQYTTDPLGGFRERFAAEQCAAAIRALK